jgi:uncharacterized protein YkwD
MKRNKYICGSFLFFLSLLSLSSSCVSNLDGIYESYQKSGMINQYNSTDIRQRHLDSLNALRQENGLGKIAISNNLNSSAATHARDIYFQQRSWNFGSDGSSPQKRADVAGFEGIVVGENVSETFEGEFLLLQVWLEDPFPRSVLLDPTASHVGLGWYQEASGKLWWVQVLGKSSGIF